MKLRMRQCLQTNECHAHSEMYLCSRISAGAGQNLPRPAIRHFSPGRRRPNKSTSSRTITLSGPAVVLVCYPYMSLRAQAGICRGSQTGTSAPMVRLRRRRSRPCRRTAPPAAPVRRYPRNIPAENTDVVQTCHEQWHSGPCHRMHHHRRVGVAHPKALPKRERGGSWQRLQVKRLRL